jgi:transcriptional regulator with XRE-family HTH domain
MSEQAVEIKRYHQTAYPIADVVSLLQPFLEREGSISALARRIGVSEAAVRKLVHGDRQWVNPRTADRWFTALGAPELLDDLKILKPWSLGKPPKNSLRKPPRDDKIGVVVVATGKGAAMQTARERKLAVRQRSAEACLKSGKKTSKVRTFSIKPQDKTKQQKPRHSKAFYPVMAKPREPSLEARFMDLKPEGMYVIDWWRNYTPDESLWPDMVEEAITALEAGEFQKTSNPVTKESE